MRIQAWILAVGIGLAAASPALAALFDHSAYDTILKNYVDTDGYVDYAGIRENSSTALDSYLGRIADADLAGWPQDERLAFWINAYNARVIHLIISHPKLRRMDDDPDLFDQEFKVAGRRLTPNDIVDRILRVTTNPHNKFGPIDGLSMAKPDVRSLFALCAGAIASPKIRPAAYTPDNLDLFFNDDVSRFANDPFNVDVRDGRLHLSAIFKIYKRDFKNAGGVPAFVGNLLNPDARLDAETLQTQLVNLYPHVVYDYDWTMNDVRNKAAANAARENITASTPPAGDSTSAPPPPTTSSTPANDHGEPNESEAPVHPSSDDLRR